ncbi:hypothetical protein RHGRI_031175 [Rhododendron griersonianum]|uniref:Uncharacterized protein n=1 Tax=Rhododendron griersonianum TaxID=479676 RepID=A0AAV6IBK0_9ERIC|nr:hypothetical protein RHGRI_031175 [Rhododendron griersonianum]
MPESDFLICFEIPVKEPLEKGFRQSLMSSQGRSKPLLVAGEGPEQVVRKGSKNEIYFQSRLEGSAVPLFKKTGLQAARERLDGPKQQSIDGRDHPEAHSTIGRYGEWRLKGDWSITLTQTSYSSQAFSREYWLTGYRRLLCQTKESPLSGSLTVKDDLGRATPGSRNPSRTASHNAFENGEAFDSSEAELAHVRRKLASPNPIQSNVNVQSSSDGKNVGLPVSYFYAARVVP